MAIWALFLLLASPASCQYFGTTAHGEGTYYGVQSPPGQGNCAFHHTGAYGEPFSAGLQCVAMNSRQWNNGDPCGMCIAFRGSGGGLGGNPVSPNWQYGVVCDQCPECKWGDLDIANNGDGRWNIEWYPVQCGVGSTGFRYHSTGTSHNYYTKMMITNGRFPVVSAKVKQNGQWSQLRRTADNHFEYDSRINYPAEFELTSLLGETVVDTVPSGGPGQSAQGVAQFAFNSAYESVGGGGPVTPAPQPSKPEPAPAPAPEPQPEQKTTTMTAKFSESATRSTSTPAPETPVAATVVAPAATTTIEPHAQCGGRGGTCDKHTCSDAPWPNTQCASGLQCAKVNEWWWKCDTDAAVAAAPAGQAAIEPWQQCGGKGGYCGNYQCEDKAWDNTYCNSGYKCQKYNEWWWHCSNK